MPLTVSTALRRRLWLGLLALLLLALVPRQGHAQDCYVSGAFGMNFGAVGTHGGTSSSSVQVVCQPDYATNRTLYYHLCLYMGPGSQSGGQPTRRMTNYNGWTLDYDLFADPAHTQRIGDVGSSPVYQLHGVVPPGSPVTLNAFIYGLVYPNQHVAASPPNYQETSIPGTIRFSFRYDSPSPTPSPDCMSDVGASGTGATSFNTSVVEASFENTCSVSATDLDFGQVVPTQAINAVSTVRVQCPANTAWKVGLDNGLNYNAGLRRMTGGGNTITYELYRDATRTQEWGNTDGAMNSGTTDNAGSAVNLTVYGKVSAQPDTPAGQYSDTVVVTLYY